MKLKSFGCSLIFGTDLADDGRHGPRATSSNHTWPALLAKELQREYHCHARAGAGNLQILDTLLSHIDDSDSLYVIGWTYSDRCDYRERNQWQTLLPHETTRLSRTYFAELQDNYRDQLSALSIIQAAVAALGSRPCIMICQDQTIFRHTGTPATEILISGLESKIHWFDGTAFVEWAHNNKYPISATKHPLEAAHRAAADYALNHFLV